MKIRPLHDVLYVKRLRGTQNRFGIVILTPLPKKTESEVRPSVKAKEVTMKK